MNSVIDRYRRQRVPSPTHCEPMPQPCSTCGRLECLCRPRFFAGQLLTADDLNRLDAYIRAKHRLHNRQLHGWGVVNGLEVSCDVCGPGVVVGCGYALSPCGDDIVVCEPVVVDVCALVKACKGAERTPVCDPPRQPSPAGCEQGEEEWILGIRYTEQPTRAIKPLMPAQAAGCGCSAPGTSGCNCAGTCKSRNCGCGNGAGKARPRSAPVQCEPTVVCEGFDFEVYRKPPDPDPSGTDDNRLRLNPESELYQRFECCAELLLRRIPKMPSELTLANVQENLRTWHTWVCSFKEYLQIYLSTRPGYSCELLARLNTVVCPPLGNDNAAVLVFQTAVLLLLVWLDALLACFCSALLPPCPTAHPSELVPLASIRVSSNPCRVLSICNWTRHRKFATTFPALQYWLAILPFGTELRAMIDRLCCFQITDIFEPRQGVRLGTVGGFAPAAGLGSTRATNGAADGPAGGSTSGSDHGFAAAQPYLNERATHRLNPTSANPERLKAAARLGSRAFARGRTPLDAQKFVESVFLADQDKDEGHLSALELANLPQFFAIEQLLRPIAAGASDREALGPVLDTLRPVLDQLGPALEALGLGSATEGPDAAPKAEAAAPANADLDAMRKEVDALREDLARQSEEIKRLQNGGRRRKEK